MRPGLYTCIGQVKGNTALYRELFHSICWRDYKESLDNFSTFDSFLIVISNRFCSIGLSVLVVYPYSQITSYNV